MLMLVLINELKKYESVVRHSFIWLIISSICYDVTYLLQIYMQISMSIFESLQKLFFGKRPHSL